LRSRSRARVYRYPRPRTCSGSIPRRSETGRLTRTNPPIATRARTERTDRVELRPRDTSLASPTTSWPADQLEGLAFEHPSSPVRSNIRPPPAPHGQRSLHATTVPRPAPPPPAASMRSRPIRGFALDQQSYRRRLRRAHASSYLAVATWPMTPHLPSTQRRYFMSRHRALLGIRCPPPGRAIP
jgi:hypothetical protein